MGKKDKDEFGAGFGGILKGLSNMVEKLGDLAEKGQDFAKTGEISGLGPGNKEIKGVYGLNVKFGLGDKELKVEPFGNIREDETAGPAGVHEVREPMVDVFEEDDYTLIVAEMPGVSAEDVQLDIKDDLLAISAERGDKKYRKEVLLPESYPREKMQVSCNNGVLEIKCMM